MTIDSDLGDTQRELPKGYVGIVRAGVAELQLQPGRYALDVGARSGDHSGLDYLAGCAQLEVLPGTTTPSAIIRDTGGVRVPATWAWSSTEAASQSQ